MMGRQIQIYFSPEDVKSLERAVTEQLGAIVLSRYHFANRVATAVSTVSKNAKGFRSSGFFVQEQDLGALVLRHIPSQGHWVIDELRSPVVEFDGGFYDGEIIRRGRLFLQKGFYGEEDRWVDKPQDFLDWAEKVFRLAKKMSRRDQKLSAYVGPFAEQMRDSGCALVFP